MLTWNPSKSLALENGGGSGTTSLLNLVADIYRTTCSFCLHTSMKLIAVPSCSDLHFHSTNDMNSLKIRRKKL